MHKTMSMNMLRRLRNSLIAIVSAFLMTVTCLPVCAYAEDVFDPERPVALTIVCEDNGTAISGAVLRMYRVADVDNSLIMTYTENFASYSGSVLPEALNPKPEEGWDATARRLNNLVVTEEIDEDHRFVTDADGKILQTELKPGLYFINAEPTIFKGSAYQMTPFMLFLPNRDDDGNWSYEVNVSPKFESYAVSATANPSVTKRFKGLVPTRRDNFKFSLAPDPSMTGYENFPMPEGSVDGKKTVTVQGSGVSYFGEIKFTAPGQYVYLVSEVNTGLDNYIYDTAIYYLIYEVTSDGNQLAVEERISEIKYDPAEVLVFTNTYSDSKLPNTGQLWWPVPLLLAAGLLCICFGLIRRNRGSK